MDGDETDLMRASEAVTLQKLRERLRDSDATISAE